MYELRAGKQDVECCLQIQPGKVLDLGTLALSPDR
jgi:hypothetical protein